MKSSYGKCPFRRLTTILLLLSATFSAVSAQETYLLNETETILYVDTPADNGYRHCPPGGLIPVDDPSTLSGFAYTRGDFVLPSVLLANPVVGDDGLIRVNDRDLSLVTAVAPADVADALSGPRLDNQYLDWVARDALFARARDRRPLATFRDSGSGRAGIDQGEALLWRRGGTDLEWMKSERSGIDLYVAASSFSAFGSRTAVNLYVYGDSEYPVATLEIDVGRVGALVLLWTPLRPEPTVVGNSVASEYLVEAQIWLDVLSGSLMTDMAATEQFSVEVATVVRSSGGWEEFVLARIPLAELLGQ